MGEFLFLSHELTSKGLYVNTIAIVVLPPMQTPNFRILLVKQ